MSHLLVVVEAVGGSSGVCVCVVLMRGAGVSEDLLLL
jgi:hypothetical protein